MDRREQVQYLNQTLLAEMPQYREQAEAFPVDAFSQRRLLRSLMNVRPPMPLAPEFLEVQDALLSTEREEKGVVDGDALPPTAGDPRLILWQGDITRLRADAIVDADNSALLGCFAPCHGCIDNAIHTYAGMQLRLTCANLMCKQGHEEPTARVKVTPAFSLPSSHIFHTVGPIVPSHKPGPREELLLRRCYTSCLDEATRQGLDTLAFCCISTGVFGYPQQAAARVAVDTVRHHLDHNDSNLKVIFNVFLASDESIYRELLQTDR